MKAVSGRTRIIRRPAGSCIDGQRRRPAGDRTEFDRKPDIPCCNVLVLKAGDGDRTRDVQGRKYFSVMPELLSVSKARLIFMTFRERVRCAPLASLGKWTPSENR